MIHRATENTVNTDKNKHFRMIGFWTLPIFGLDFIKFELHEPEPIPKLGIKFP